MRPNILYIMSDDHAANAISCYHSILQSVFQTPNMDRYTRKDVEWMPIVQRMQSVHLHERVL